MLRPALSSQKISRTVGPVTTVFGHDGQKCHQRVGIIGITELHLKAQLQESSRLCLEHGDWSKLEDVVGEAAQLSLSECGQELFAMCETLELSSIEGKLAPLLCLCRELEPSKQRWIARHILTDILPFSCGQLSWELFTVIAAVIVSQTLAANAFVTAAAEDGAEEHGHHQQDLLDCYRSIALTWTHLLHATVTIPALHFAHFLNATRLHALPSLWMMRGTFSQSLRMFSDHLCGAGEDPV